MKVSKEQKLFLKKYYIKKVLILFIQLFISFVFLVVWEVLSRKKIINPFVFSSPKKIIRCIVELYKKKNLLAHIWVTIYETLIAFVIGMLISIILSTCFYLYPNIYKIFDPYLTCLNSLPKVALGPMIIIVCGANTKSIIVMAILINCIVSTLVITSGFYNTDPIKLKLLQSMRANKYQTLYYLVFPSNYSTIISSLKLSISMSMIGLLPPVGEKIFFNKCYSRY